MPTPFATESPSLLANGPDDGAVAIILAHGAGAPMDSPFMETMAVGLGVRGFRVRRFEFPYMATRRVSGQRRPPDRPAVLTGVWHAAIAGVRDEHPAPKRVIIGGKSMGGRMASLIADEAAVDGLVCLGYPFHPPGRPERSRTEHLATLRTPTLIVQGERDALGGRAEVATYALSDAIRVVWLPDGDHSFAPRKRSGHTIEANLAAAVDETAAFAAQSG
jgi:predicted alpha/beta-hydrolase family hydrolase